MSLNSVSGLKMAFIFGEAMNALDEREDCEDNRRCFAYTARGDRLAQCAYPF